MVLFSEAELDMAFNLKCTIATLFLGFWFEHIAIMHFFQTLPHVTVTHTISLSSESCGLKYWSSALCFCPHAELYYGGYNASFYGFLIYLFVPVVCHRYGHDWSWGHRCGIRLTNGIEEEEEKEGQIQWPQSSRVSTFAHPGFFFTVSFPPCSTDLWLKYLQELLWWIKQLFGYFHYCI